jgi:hypothetical protein
MQDDAFEVSWMPGRGGVDFGSPGTDTCGLSMSFAMSPPPLSAQARMPPGCTRCSDLLPAGPHMSSGVERCSGSPHHARVPSTDEYTLLLQELLRQSSGSDAPRTRERGAPASVMLPSTNTDADRYGRWGRTLYHRVLKFWTYDSVCCACGHVAFAPRTASQAFEHVHNTLSHREKTEVPGVTDLSKALCVHAQKGLALPCASHSGEIALVGSRCLRSTLAAAPVLLGMLL